MDPTLEPAHRWGGEHNLWSQRTQGIFLVARLFSSCLTVIVALKNWRYQLNAESLQSHFQGSVLKLATCLEATRKNGSKEAKPSNALSILKRGCTRHSETGTQPASSREAARTSPQFSHHSATSYPNIAVRQRA